MADESNPFANPYERGFLLPPGCKDLIDATGGAGKAQRFESLKFGRGELDEVRAYFRELYEEKLSTRCLIITNLELKAILMIRGEKNVYELTFTYPQGNQFLENAISELFSKQDVSSKWFESPLIAKNVFVKITLPAGRDDAAQRTKDLLVRGYGLRGNSSLLFHLLEEK